MTGTGAFEVKGGGVAGSYSGAGTALTAVTVPGGGSGPATLNLAMTGAVAGTAAKPMLQGTVHGSGTVSVDDGGFSRAVPVDFDGVLGDGAGAALDVRSARCGETGGVWSVALGPVSGASSAPPVSGTATFVAIRTDDASGAVPAYATQVGQLLSDVEAFAARFEDAPDEGGGGSPPVDVDVVSLDSDLDRAEAVSRSLPAVDACTADASYSSVVSVEIDRLLSAAAAQPAADRHRRAARPHRCRLPRRLRWGAPAAAKGSLARERTLRTELAHRLDAAVSAHDPRTAATIAAVSRQVGWARLARRATRAREAQGAGAIAEVSGIAVNGSRARPVFGWQAPAGAARVPGRGPRRGAPPVLGVAGRRGRRAGRRRSRRPRARTAQPARREGIDVERRGVRRDRSGGRRDRAAGDHPLVTGARGAGSTSTLRT